MNDDQRRDPRVLCRARVDFGSPEEVLLDREVDNLSLGGACLRVNVVPRIDAPVTLTLTFPELGSATVDIEARVVWVNPEPPRDIGVRFVSMTTEDRELLGRYVALHAR